MIRVFFYALMLLLFLPSCKEQADPVPPGIIPPDSMVTALAEFHLVEAKLVMSATRSLSKEEKSAFVLSMLHKSAIDTARFNKSFEYYTGHPVQFSEIYEQVITEISRRQAENK